ncbi:hypothetical protein GQ53DRAFT_451343 [Thozetella sp. PMI_491]|nr:hypothetical protein GQ53DRAFT_451343 [Thozetella sp. PMI_491]
MANGSTHNVQADCWATLCAAYHRPSLGFCVRAQPNAECGPSGPSSARRHVRQHLRLWEGTHRRQKGGGGPRCCETASRTREIPLNRSDAPKPRRGKRGRDNDSERSLKVCRHRSDTLFRRL